MLIGTCKLVCWSLEYFPSAAAEECNMAYQHWSSLVNLSSSSPLSSDGLWPVTGWSSWNSYVVIIGHAAWKGVFLWNSVRMQAWKRKCINVDTASDCVCSQLPTLNTAVHFIWVKTGTHFFSDEQLWVSLDFNQFALKVFMWRLFPTLSCKYSRSKS